MDKRIKLLLLSIFVIAVLYLSFKLPADEKMEIESFGEKSVGTLTNHGLKTVDISYDYKGQNFIYTRSIPYSDLVEGEQYEITISKKDPSRVILHMDKPYIDTVTFKYVEITPIKVGSIFVDDTELEFKYTVAGNNFRRIQKYIHEDSVPKNFQNLSVKYRSDRPEIAYLVLK
jgi:hypothetical protein